MSYLTSVSLYLLYLLYLFNFDVAVSDVGIIGGTQMHTISEESEQVTQSDIKILTPSSFSSKLITPNKRYGDASSITSKHTESAKTKNSYIIDIIQEEGGDHSSSMSNITNKLKVILNKIETQPYSKEEVKSKKEIRKSSSASR
jgi:hypothetical protein